MTMETPQIKSLQAAFRSMPAATPCEDCPEPAILWTAVQGEAGGLSPEKRREIIQHTANCSACAEDWRLTSDLWRAQWNGTPCEVLNGHPSWFRKTLPKIAAQVAAAGLVVLAVGIGSFWFHQVPSSNFRGTVPKTEAQQGPRSLLPQGAKLSRSAFILRWTAEVPSALYTLHLQTETGQSVITKTDLKESEFVVPEDKLRGFSPGTSLYWQVEVTLPSGEHRESDYFPVSID